MNLEYTKLFFSDHKPIYIGITENASNTNEQSNINHNNNSIKEIKLKDKIFSNNIQNKKMINFELNKNKNKTPNYLCKLIDIPNV